MRYLLLFVLALLAVPAKAQATQVDSVTVVKQFTAAFNSQDSAAMAELVTHDVQWLSVNGASITVETSGRKALVTAMDGYFASCATCRSKLLQIQALGKRVSVLEQASWRVDSEERSQSSIAVYELKGERIHRVYYFASN